MPHYDFDTRRAPARWAPAIFNDDYSGMDARDTEECNLWLACLRSEGWQVCGTEEVEPWFAHSGHAGTMACEVFTYEMLRTAEARSC